MLPIDHIITIYPIIYIYYLLVPQDCVRNKMSSYCLAFDIDPVIVD